MIPRGAGLRRGGRGTGQASRARVDLLSRLVGYEQWNAEPSLPDCHRWTGRRETRRRGTRAHVSPVTRSGAPAGAEHPLCSGAHWGTRQRKSVPPLSLGRCQWAERGAEYPPTRPRLGRARQRPAFSGGKIGGPRGELNQVHLLHLNGEPSAKKQTIKQRNHKQNEVSNGTQCPTA